MLSDQPSCLGSVAPGQMRRISRWPWAPDSERSPSRGSSIVGVEGRRCRVLAHPRSAGSRGMLLFFFFYLSFFLLRTSVSVLFVFSFEEPPTKSNKPRRDKSFTRGESRGRRGERKDKTYQAVYYHRIEIILNLMKRLNTHTHAEIHRAETSRRSGREKNKQTKKRRSVTFRNKVPLKC